MADILYKWWQRFTQPAPSLETSDQRQQARLLSALLFIHMLFTTIEAVSQVLLNTDSLLGQEYYLLVFLVLIAAYVLSRTRYYLVGAALYIGGVFLSVFAVILIEPGTIPDRVFNFLVLGVFLTSLLVSLRATVIMIVLNAAGIVLLPIFVSNIGGYGTYAALTYFLLMSVLILVASFLRQQNMRQIKEQTQELTESEERYRSLMDASFEAVAIHDNGTLLDVNHAFEKMFGCTLDEAIGRTALDFTIPAAVDTLRQWWRNGSQGRLETIGRRQDGSNFPIEIISKDHTYKGRAVSVAAFQDLTERKESERQRQALDAEKERAAILRQFIGEASHDLQTPLTNLKTSLYLLKRFRNDPKKQQEHLLGLEKQTQRLERLVTDFFTMSRIDAAATAEFQFGAIDLNSIVAEVIESQQDLIDRKGHDLTFDPAADLALVLADRAKIGLAFSSVLINACNYTPHGGKIRIETFNQDSRAAVRVTDNGIGIAETALPHIFESFFRADEARSSDTGGSGLGLAIAKRIVDRHRGNIEVESVPHQGSVFTIFLPAARPNSV